MTEFVNFVTKNIEFDKDDNRRIFSGHITAEIVDHQNDFIFVKEVMKVMDTFMKVLPVLSEVHTNRMIGKVLSYEKSEIEGHASVKITAEVFKQEGVELYDKVWEKIKKGEYAGLSMGGGSKTREPIFKNGRYVMNLADLELYEIAVCPSPANPLAIIDKFNKFAKSELFSNKAHEIDNRNIVQCSSISCEFNKGTDSDKDVDIDNEQEKDKKVSKTDTSNSSEIGEDTRRPTDINPESSDKEHKKQQVSGEKLEHEEDLEQFDKPEVKKKSRYEKAVLDYIEEMNKELERKESVISNLEKKIESTKIP